MRAEERHRLKTNELAQKLSELSEYLRQHSKLISIVVVSVLVICVVGGLWWSERKKSYSRRNDELQGLLPQIVQIQYGVAKAAQDPKTQSKATYNISSLLGALDNLSSEAQGTPIGMMALLQQADLKRSELYYTHRLLSDQEREQICQALENIYNKILSQYGNQAQPVGTAQLGMALVAEDRGEWEKAKKKYEEILAEKDGKLNGTIFPLLAQRRLRMITEDKNNDGIADITVSIDFPYIEPAPEPEEPVITEANKKPIDPRKSIEPPEIEFPPMPVPQANKDNKFIGPVQEETEIEKKTEGSTQPDPGSAEEKPVEG